ncbi:NAD(P)-binding domain-containing protein [Lactococcus lactis]
MAQANFGVVGMAVMGKNLALNVESRGYTVAIYNRTTSKTEEVYKEHQDKNLVLTKTLEEFVGSLENHVVSCSWFKQEQRQMRQLNHFYHSWIKAIS